MRFISSAFVGILLSICISVPVSHAWFVPHVSRIQMTSRQVKRTAKYIQDLDRKEFLENSQRKRLSDEPPVTSSQTLRDPFRRVVRPAETSSEVINRQRTFQSPVLSPFTKASKFGKQPVSIETEAFYRNGIKYYVGTGIQKDYGFAFMWLNFALSDGHPLAREALLEVARHMNPRQLADARERTKLLSSKFLDYADRRGELIRDRARERDIKELMIALLNYRNSSDKMQYPVPITEDGKEVCLLTAATCRDLLNFKGMVPDFILTIPSDPLADAGGNTASYTILIDQDGKLTIYAPLSEASLVILKEGEE